MFFFASHADYIRKFDLWLVYVYFKTNNRCVGGIWKQLHGYDKARTGKGNMHFDVIVWVK